MDMEVGRWQKQRSVVVNGETMIVLRLNCRSMNPFIDILVRGATDYFSCILGLSEFQLTVQSSSS